VAVALSRNDLLGALSAAQLLPIKEYLEPVSLKLRDVLEKAGKPIQHVYFPFSGLASIVAHNKDRGLEVGLIGKEGMSGIAVLLGGKSAPTETFIQVEGDGVRLPVAKLREALEEDRAMERHFLKYAYSFLYQTMNVALSNGTASVEERLARWLLMANDRLGDDRVPLTHEFLSLMLGVRRAGVTVALNLLERKAMIQLARGEIVITDREGLEASANGTYHAPEPR
jgi:CRP-like cAMP-binding protein